MVREAEEHAEEYEAQRRHVEQEVQVTSLADSLSSLLAKREAMLPSELVASIKEALAAPTGGDLATRLTTLEELWRQANVTSDQPG